ncbi:flagellar FlbD family protein [Tepidiforma flava]|uniref:flagellar FlbD family protein n=1 Tax=Tepidiforma flava TaxID=3004094 RepID=UPI0035715E75
MEASHDTHITLTNGHRYVCQESPETIIDQHRRIPPPEHRRHPEVRLMDLATVIGLVRRHHRHHRRQHPRGRRPHEAHQPPGLLHRRPRLPRRRHDLPAALRHDRQLPKFILKAFFGGAQHNSAETVELFVQMADKARREGLLALDSRRRKNPRPAFTRKGVSSS